MKNFVFLFCAIALSAFISCDDDGPYEDYLVARPIVQDAISFKAEAVDVTEPVTIVSSGKIYAYQDYIFVNDLNLWPFQFIPNRCIVARIHLT